MDNKILTTLSVAAALANTGGVNAQSAQTSAPAAQTQGVTTPDATATTASAAPQQSFSDWLTKDKVRVDNALHDKGTSTDQVLQAGGQIAGQAADTAANNAANQALGGLKLPINIGSLGSIMGGGNPFHHEDKRLTALKEIVVLENNAQGHANVFEQKLKDLQAQPNQPTADGYTTILLARYAEVAKDHDAIAQIYEKSRDIKKEADMPPPAPTIPDLRPELLPAKVAYTVGENLIAKPIPAGNYTLPEPYFTPITGMKPADVAALGNSPAPALPGAYTTAQNRYYETFDSQAGIGKPIDPYYKTADALIAHIRSAKDVTISTLSAPRKAELNLPGTLPMVKNVGYSGDNEATAQLQLDKITDFLTDRLGLERASKLAGEMLLPLDQQALGVGNPSPAAVKSR